MTPITVLILVVATVSLTFTWVCEACAALVRTKPKKPTHRPPISVLKPLKGADQDLYANLASLAAQNYPSFELVFACEEANDPALAVVRRLQADFPNVDITFVAGATPIGWNPKINNLHQAARLARHDHLLISDADVRVDENYLEAMVAELRDPAVGLVSSPVAGVGERSLGSALDNLHLNTFVVGSVCAAPILAKHACVVGKSMLFRFSDFARLGGWAKVKDVLAEDYVLGQLFEKGGYGVALSAYVVRAVNRGRSVTEFMGRHVRWGQMRRHLAGPVYWCEPLMLPGVWTALALAVLLVQQATPLVTLAMTLAAILGGFRALSSALLIRTLRGQWPSALALVAMPAKDLIVVGLWVWAAVHTTINWRGNTFRIGAGSLLSPVPEKATPQGMAIDL